ncbi:glucosaminidase domain-containing protein [Komagataeibacter kakiaceti]
MLNDSKLSNSVNRVTISSGVNAKPSSSSSSVPDAVIQAAQTAQRKWKVPASITIAQWMLESGSGKRMPSHSNNPFGIKAGRGQSFVLAPPHEETKDHKLIATIAPFRVFSSLDEAFDQHERLLAMHPAYRLARQSMNDPDAYADASTGAYAS